MVLYSRSIKTVGIWSTAMDKKLPVWLTFISSANLLRKVPSVRSCTPSSLNLSFSSWFEDWGPLPLGYCISERTLHHITRKCLSSLKQSLKNKISTLLMIHIYSGPPQIKYIFMYICSRKACVNKIIEKVKQHCHLKKKSLILLGPHYLNISY